MWRRVLALRLGYEGLNRLVLHERSEPAEPCQRHAVAVAVVGLLRHRELVDLINALRALENCLLQVRRPCVTSPAARVFSRVSLRVRDPRNSRLVMPRQRVAGDGVSSWCAEAHGQSRTTACQRPVQPLRQQQSAGSATPFPQAKNRANIFTFDSLGSLTPGGQGALSLALGCAVQARGPEIASRQLSGESSRSKLVFET